MTRADKIRSMTDEGFIPEEMCVGCLVAYLRQEDEN